MDLEVAELQRVFDKGFNFTTYRWKIPSVESEDKLLHRILDFRRGKSPHDLLLLYYGGHADGNSQECIWAANLQRMCPTLNWHNVQSTLLGCAASVLLILDCCFATSAAKANSVGDNWFLGASSKESTAAGVSRSSFTSALTRELDLLADQYRKTGTTFTVQSVHSGLVLWERHLKSTPQLLRLTDHECPPTELTPLYDPPERPTVQPTKSYPVEQPSSRITSPPRRLKHSSTVPSNAAPYRAPDRTLANSGSPDPSEEDSALIHLAPDETQTLRVSGLPLVTEKIDLVHWFEDRLDRGSIISSIGPLLEPPGAQSTKETVITFSSVSITARVQALDDLNFSTKKRSSKGRINIDDSFQGLTCIYSSIKNSNEARCVDIVLVHGAYGHAINSFATKYIEPIGHFSWPCDALAKSLNEVGICSRVMTFGWDADAWLDSKERTPNSDGLVKSLKERSMGKQNPLFFIGHGVGGLLVKQFVTETVNFGFSLEDFENPVKGCFLFAVPNQDTGLDDGYAYIVASMESRLREECEPKPALVRALKSRNRAINSLSTEFEQIRHEYGINCITFSEKRKTAGGLIVTPDQSMLPKNEGNTYQVDADHSGIVKLPKTEEYSKIVDILRAAICEQLGVSLPPSLNKDSLQPEVTEYPIRKMEKPSATPFVPRPADKEKVFAQLRRYDTSILIDDSDSMNGRRWKIAKHVLDEIVPIAVKYDKNGVDVRFFNEFLENEERKNITSPEKVIELFKSATPPEGETPTADMLEIELNEYIHEYKLNRSIKGLNLIVLTDGEPSPGQDVERVIVKYAKKLEELEAPPLQVGIQFVQIGSDEKAATFLKALDDDLQTKWSLDRDVRRLPTRRFDFSTNVVQMVDTVPWIAGDEQRLYEKILLGGILKRLDNE